MGTKYTSQSPSGYNASPPADDGSTADSNKVKWSTHISKIGGPLYNWISAINDALVTALDLGPSSKATAYTTVAGDHQKTIETTGTTTITLGSAASMGAGYKVTVKNAGSGTVTVATSDTIDGSASSQTLTAGWSKTYQVNAAGSGYYSIDSTPVGTAGDVVAKCNTANTFSATQQISQVGNAAPAYYNLLSDSGQNALHYVHDGIIQRWGFGKQDTTSDFVIYRYNSSGAFQGTPFFIEEDTGYVNFSGYTGSTDTNTDYPIGTLLSVYVSTAPYARNASNAIKYTSANNYSFTHASGTGTSLTGTWRARGVSGIANQSGTVEYYQMFQRTA